MYGWMNNRWMEDGWMMGDGWADEWMGNCCFILQIEVKEARNVMVEANNQEYAFNYLQQSLNNKIQDAEVRRRTAQQAGEAAVGQFQSKKASSQAPHMQ